MPKPALVNVGVTAALNEVPLETADELVNVKARFCEPAEITMVAVIDSLRLFASVTVAIKVALPAAVGVPLTTAVPVLKVRPRADNCVAPGAFRE